MVLKVNVSLEFLGIVQRESSFSGMAGQQENSVEVELYFYVHPDRRGLSIWA